MHPKHDGEAVLQTTVQIAYSRYTLCAVCMNVIRWVDRHGKTAHGRQSVKGGNKN